jgi:hypothetical protein
MLLKSGEKKGYAACQGEATVAIPLNNFVAFPTSRLRKRKVLARMRLFRVPVLAHKRVGIFFLIEVAKGVIDFTVLALVCTDCCALARHLLSTIIPDLL